jgi:hypothetical protein
VPPDAVLPDRLPVDAVFVDAVFVDAVFVDAVLLDVGPLVAGPMGAGPPELGRVEGFCTVTVTTPVPERTVSTDPGGTVWLVVPSVTVAPSGASIVAADPRPSGTRTGPV